MATFGFTAQQIDILYRFMNRQQYSVLPAPQACASTPELPPPAPPQLPPQATSPPAPQPCAQTPPKLPPLPPTDPPSVKILQEVEHTWKHRDSKALPKIRIAKSKNCIGWPPKLGGIYICFSRDEEPDAWYTTMLNYRQKLVKPLSNTA